MKKRTVFSLFLLCSFLYFPGCGSQKNKEFKRDVATLGEVMCRIMENSNKLLVAQSMVPMDTFIIRELQVTREKLEIEITTLNAEFRKNYAKEMKDPKFVKDFGTEIKKTMLDCKYLSKEDRAKYIKEVE